jgi:hypothetical protein
MPENWTKELPQGWRGGEAVTKWWRGSMLHLYRLRKPCAQCADEMVIDVTAAALEGKAKNAGLLLQRCQNCRAAAKGGTSRPRTNKAPSPAVSSQAPAQAAVSGADPGELAELKAERDEYAQSVMDQGQLIGTLKRENEQLKARLAQYELPAAMAAANKMPWE